MYITSANGVSKTGELVNIDGTGNRVSQTYSDRKKYILSLEPISLSGLHLHGTCKTDRSTEERSPSAGPDPVCENGRCVDCNSPARICHSIVILERPSNGMEVEVVFVDEEMGY